MQTARRFSFSATTQQRAMMSALSALLTRGTDSVSREFSSEDTTLSPDTLAVRAPTLPM